MDSRAPAVAGSHAELILRTVDEGGSLTLAAQRTPTGWTQFTLIVDQSPMVELVGEDAAGIPNEVIQAAGPAEAWDGAAGVAGRLRLGHSAAGLRPPRVPADGSLSGTRARGGSGQRLRGLHRRLAAGMGAGMLSELAADLPRGTGTREMGARALAFARPYAG